MLVMSLMTPPQVTPGTKTAIKKTFKEIKTEKLFIFYRKYSYFTGYFLINLIVSHLHLCLELVCFRVGIK